MFPDFFRQVRDSVAVLLEVGDIEPRGLRRQCPLIHECFQSGEHKGHAGLVVEKSAFEKARRGDLEAGVEEDEVPYLDPQGTDIISGADRLIEAYLHVLVSSEGFPHGLGKSVDGATLRQKGTPDLPPFGGTDEEVFRLERGPGEPADLQQAKAAVRLYLPDDGPEGIHVGGDHPVFVIVFSLQGCEDRPFSGFFSHPAPGNGIRSPPGPVFPGNPPPRRGWR